MGGSSNRQKKASLLSFLMRGSTRRQRSRVEDAWSEEVGNGRSRAWTSDEDKRHWVAEPGIDRKASAFIANFHASRVSDSLQFQAEKA